MNTTRKWSVWRSQGKVDETGGAVIVPTWRLLWRAVPGGHSRSAPPSGLAQRRHDLPSEAQRPAPGARGASVRRRKGPQRNPACCSGLCLALRGRMGTPTCDGTWGHVCAERPGPRAPQCGRRWPCALHSPRGSHGDPMFFICRENVRGYM